MKEMCHNFRMIYALLDGEKTHVISLQCIFRSEGYHFLFI